MNGLNFILQVFLVGAIATAALDVWQLLVKVTFGVPATNWALVGRWFCHIPRGKLIHNGITNTEPVPGEAILGWIAHYAVGLIYAAIYLSAVWFVLDAGPTLTSALVFGAVTVFAPWLLLQPGMGLGVFARRAPKPRVARVHSLSSHVAFGAGLYLAFSTFGTVL
jgi:hypothetical protein